MKKNIMPYAAKALSSDCLLHAKRKVQSIKRNVLKREPAVDVYLKIDDPYSYLLVQALVNFTSRFAVSLRFHVFHDIDIEMYPNLDMWNNYSRYDTVHLAELYQFDFPLSPAVRNEEVVNNCACKLVSLEASDDFLEEAKNLLHSFWFGGEITSTRNATEQQLCQSKLAENKQLLTQQGHYLGAMLHFEGEWYWGVDRLDHLEQRLIDAGLTSSHDVSIQFNRTYQGFCNETVDDQHVAKPGQHITLYWSARSPYSYIGLEKAILLSRHYKIPLDIKPVLPMVMRGMSVPTVKKMYIFMDTKREARKLGLPYGFVADPLGAAVERCYALVDYAESEGKREDFLLSFARAVNSEGIRAETDDGMKQIITRCGLDWNIAKPNLDNQNWRTWADNNLDEMFAIGCWGVPTICYGNTHFWGQDRFGLLEQKIRGDMNNHHPSD